MTVSQDAPETVLSENVELPRLVDLCAKRLDLNIQYDASQLKGALTLRIGRGVSDAELWVLTNRLLASRGFTSVRLPGEDTLNIVKLAEAAPLARVEAEGLDDTDAGFVKVMVELNHRTPQDVLDPLKLTLTRAAGTATAVGKTRRLLLADLRPNLVQALDLLRLLDVPPAETTIEPIAIRFLSAADLVSQVEKVAASQAAVSGRQRSGKLLASSDGQGVLLVAPGDEISYWRLLIEQLDRGEEREVRTYLPERFALGEVSGLIEEVVLGQDEGARKRWRMISDELTGSLIVTATVSQHQQIQQLLERLEAVPRLEGVMEQVPTRHLDANSLIAMVEKAATVRSTVTEQKLRGKLLPAPDGKKVLVFAPAAETALWLELLAEMDQREALETVSYSPRYFPVDEVGELIEQLAGAQGSTQADSGWRMIQDSLTGTLIVTATRRQHLQIDELMTRLDGATPTARRPFRSFALKNRAAADLVSLLQELISGGALEATTGSDQEGDSVAVQPPLVTPEVSQVTPVPSREVLQPPTSPSSGATALSFEGEELLLTADPETNTLIAIGEARLLEQLEGLIAQLDVRQPQVLIEALVLSLTESDALDLGVEIQRFGTPDDTLVALSQLFGLGSPNPSDPSPNS
jgi:type II secretory pathway component GspD/PulD (secretin)